MHISLLTAALGSSFAVQSALGAPALTARAPFKVLVGNDDGWAEANIRAFYQTLTAAGYDTILSAPVQNQSGTGSSDSPAKALTKAGQYNSVPTGSPAQGANATDPRLNYVNSYPVTAIEYGTSTVAPKYFGGAPDLIVTGPNLGVNLGSTTSISGTVGAATEGVLEGIPSIAFSGTSGSGRSYTTLKAGDQSFIYAQVSQQLIAALTATAKPWLPSGVGLNVNLPAISTTCASAKNFQFPKSYTNSPVWDAVTCNNGGHLPTESTVIKTSGKCYVTVSVFDASNKRDGSVAQQAAVLNKLSSVLVCS
ncbi:sure-like protein [Ceratobasidium sp. AG-I]|nr:sure-like protein [Ceratobasidium sp. AG-I]